MWLFLRLAVVMLDLTQDARERSILIKIWIGTSNYVMLIIHPPQLRYLGILGTNFHLSSTRMDWWQWTGSFWMISSQSRVEGGVTVKKRLDRLSNNIRRSNLFLGIIKGSKPALTAPTLSPMSIARIQVVNGLTTKVTPVAWYVFAVW